MGIGKDKILLLCDLGNSSAKFALARGDCFQYIFRLPVTGACTADSLGLMLKAALAHIGGEAKQPDICVAVSVAPACNDLLEAAVRNYCGCGVVFAGLELGIPLVENGYEKPQELGLDRIVAAYAARVKWPLWENLLLVDYGTAITCDWICGLRFEGGLIFPGPGLAAHALATGTASLPYANPLADRQIRKKLEESPDKCLEPGRSTRSCIVNGLLQGYRGISIALCESLITRMDSRPLLIATGGQAHLLAPLAGIFNKIEPNLILNGLTHLYESQLVNGF